MNVVSLEVHYRADELGFQVAANNLPQFIPANLPEPVRDTLEVEAAKQQHLQAWQAIADHQQAQGKSVPQAYSNT